MLNSSSKLRAIFPKTQKSCLSLSYTCPSCRALSTSAARRTQDSRPFHARLRSAWKNTKIQWRPIPVGLGIASVGALQFYRIQARERGRNRRVLEDEEAEKAEDPRFKRKRPKGPWTVQLLSTLPLRAFSRLWGRLNEIQLPYYFRVPGFKLYSLLFGVKYVLATQSHARSS